MNRGKKTLILNRKLNLSIKNVDNDDAGNGEREGFNSMDFLRLLMHFACYFIIKNCVQKKKSNYINLIQYQEIKDQPCINESNFEISIEF